MIIDIESPRMLPRGIELHLIEGNQSLAETLGGTVYRYVMLHPKPTTYYFVDIHEETNPV
jgi:hypothetical protein